MTDLSLRPSLQKFAKSALVLLGAALLGSSLAAETALANSLSSAPVADGVYLYGEQPIANQLGSTYMVFEVTGNRAVGAFYMPSSSFDCFSGSVSSTRLSLMILDSYEQTRHPYALAVQPTLTAGQAGAELNIQGFTAIDTLSALDERILNTCQNVQADTI